MSDSTEIIVSPLAHTWLIDLDGTLVEHNGHLEGDDLFLPGAIDFLRSIPSADNVFLMTARSESQCNPCLSHLSKFGISIRQVIYDLPVGERVLINDIKPSGLRTAIAVNVSRDSGLEDLKITIDPEK
jgi:hypothetical protein